MIFGYIEMKNWFCSDTLKTKSNFDAKIENVILANQFLNIIQLNECFLSFFFFAKV